MRYVVPYSAPGVRWGQLRIDADSSDDALAKAQEIHASTVRLSRSSGACWLGARGPATRHRSHYNPAMKLRKRERAQIVYSEPLALVDAVAS